MIDPSIQDWREILKRGVACCAERRVDERLMYHESLGSRSAQVVNTSSETLEG